VSPGGFALAASRAWAADGDDAAGGAPGLRAWLLLALGGTAEERVGVDPPEDAALVKQASGGDRRAFDQLYRRHVDQVYRRVSHLVGPDPEREDLVQQIFLEAFRALPSFRGDAAFTTWLYRIIVNVSYDHLRRRGRRNHVPVEAAHLDQLSAPTLCPESSLRQREQVARMLTFLGRLKPKKRIAFVLRVVEGLSLDEIADVVGARAPAVGQRIKHAHRELDQMIARDEQRQGGRS
jgi:RNA polymerase sigma-70 factor (ECF subfamily)